MIPWPGTPAVGAVVAKPDEANSRWLRSVTAWRAVLAALAYLLLVLLVAAPASAAPGWLPLVDLSAAGQNARAPQIAVDARSNAIAVWERDNGLNSIVQGAVRAWRAPMDLSVADQSAAVPQVAVNASGNAVAVWTRFNGAHYIVQGAVRPAGSAWQTPVELSAAGESAAAPQVGIDARGDAVAVWTRQNAANPIVQGAVHPAGSAFWQTPVDLSTVGQTATRPQVAVDAQGNAVAVWMGGNGSDRVVQGAVRPAGGAWQAPVDVSAAGQNANRPQVAVNAQGNAVAVWERDNHTDSIVQGAVRPAGGAWQAPLDVSAAGQFGSAPQVAVNAQGNAVAVWRRSNGTHWIVQGAVRPAGASWQAPVDVSVGGGTASDPQVAADGQGNVIAVWPRFNGTNSIVQGAVRPAGGLWQAPVDVSVAGQEAYEPQVAVDAHAVAVWTRFNGANTTVQAAEYDAA